MFLIDAFKSGLPPKKSSAAATPINASSRTNEIPITFTSLHLLFLFLYV